MELYLRIELKMQEVQDSGTLTWIEVQFMKSACDTLMKCRQDLKWTYALAYYLEKSNHTTLFENNQKDLELAVEALSGLLEAPIEFDQVQTLKKNVLDKAFYVSSRREILLQDTIMGLEQRRWGYNVD